MSHLRNPDGSVPVAESMTYSPSSRLDSLDPASIRPIYDRILVRDIPKNEVSAAGLDLSAAPSLHGLGKSGRIRVGEVVAVGTGDKFYEWIEYGKVKKKPYPCRNFWLERGGLCARRYTTVKHPGIIPEDAMWTICEKCHGTGYATAPLQVRVGDRVALDRRREAEITIDGQLYTLCYESQAVYGVFIPKSWLCIRCLQMNYSGAPCVGCGITAEESCVPDKACDEFEPLYDRILIDPIAPDGQVGSIHIPDIAKKDSGQGIVRAVGCGKRGSLGLPIPPAVKVGDRVLFGAYSHHFAEEITLFGEKSIIIREKNIWAVLED